MKLTIKILIDDQTIAENVANLEHPDGAKVDPMTVQWMLLGMLADATRTLEVRKAEEPAPVEEPDPRLDALRPADGVQ